MTLEIDDMYLLDYCKYQPDMIAIHMLLILYSLLNTFTVKYRGVPDIWIVWHNIFYRLTAYWVEQRLCQRQMSDCCMHDLMYKFSTYWTEYFLFTAVRNSRVWMLALCRLCIIYKNRFEILSCSVVFLICELVIF